MSFRSGSGKIVLGSRVFGSIKMRGLWCHFVVALIALISTTLRAEAMEILSYRWGIAERCKPKSHSLLTVTLRNRGKSCTCLVQVRAVSSSARTEREVFADSGASVRIAIPVWVSPEISSYHLLLNSSDGRAASVSISAPSFGAPGRAFLDSENPARILDRGIIGFPAAELPARLPLLDSVESLLLAHEPQWTLEQATTLRDWIWRGGRLHVFFRDDGRWPKFEGGLEFINQESPVLRFGAGVIVKHSRAVWGMTNLELNRLGYPLSVSEIEEDNDFVASRDARMAAMGLLSSELPLLTYSWNSARLIIIVYSIIVGFAPMILSRLRRRQSTIMLLMGLSVFLASFLLYQLSAADRARGNAMAEVRVLSELSDGRSEVGYQLYATPQAQVIELEENQGFLDVPPDENSPEAVAVRDGKSSKIRLDCADLSRRVVFRSHRSERRLPAVEVLDARWDSRGEGRRTLVELKLSRPKLPIAPGATIISALALTEESASALEEGWYSREVDCWHLRAEKSVELMDLGASIMEQEDFRRRYRGQVAFNHHYPALTGHEGISFVLKMVTDGHRPNFKYHRLEPRSLGKRVELYVIVEGGESEKETPSPLPVVSELTVYHWTVRVPYPD